ncbi:MAG: AAA-like domain-containing protein, partial [Leptolyngbyaceae cyanobacterium]
IHTVLIDVRQVEAEALNSLDRFLRWFCWNLGQQLQIAPEFDRYWFEAAGSSLSCTTYIQEVFLNRLQQPILVAIDKVHQLADYDVLARSFFPLLRSWHEQARVDLNWQKLRLLLTYSTELDLPLQPHQSPFNVGLSLPLPKLTPDQSVDLAKRYGLETIGLADTSSLAPLLDLMAGHPYLLQLAFYQLRSGALSLDELLRSAPTSNGIYHSYLQPFWQMVQRDDRLFEAFSQVSSTSAPIAVDLKIAHRLEGMGLVTVYGCKVRPSCELYRQYFKPYLEA